METTPPSDDGNSWFRVPRVTGNYLPGKSKICLHCISLDEQISPYMDFAYYRYERRTIMIPACAAGDITRSNESSSEILDIA